jgi:uncharacterized membrane protein
MARFRPPRRYRIADSAQQVVGGFLLAGPFVVTEEVWTLAENMNALQALATVVIVFAIGYAALYEAAGRDPEDSPDVAGIPIRFVSLMIVSYGSVAVLAVTLGAPETFLPDRSGLDQVAVAAKAIGVGAIFSVVGAATADSVF